MELWSDNRTNFVGAAHEISALFQFLRSQHTKSAIIDFLSSHKIEWKFIPQHAPHFGGLWEACVISMKTHLHRIVGNVKTYIFDYSCITNWCMSEQQATRSPSEWWMCCGSINTRTFPHLKTSGSAPWPQSWLWHAEKPHFSSSLAIVPIIVKTFLEALVSWIY